MQTRIWIKCIEEGKQKLIEDVLLFFIFCDAKLNIFMLCNLSLMKETFEDVTKWLIKEK